MARVHDLLGKIADAELREALAAEVKKLEKGKKFGLVFENHLPEATPLYDVKVKAGMNVATRIQDNGALFVVKSIKDGVATCIPCAGGQEVEYPVDDLVAVAMFGEAIYPYLQKLDQIEHGGGDLWHALIQADNYHALQLLEYLYAGKVDCIYIDPPYNTGAKDWKYNNDYVDGNDAWRHSKWLSMMEKRLKIAKRLLNPADSVLIVTIDEKEYLHLGMLLEQMFPEARIQMVSSVINHASVARDNEFNRNNEFVFFVMLGAYRIAPLDESKNFLEGDSVHWETLRRHNAKNVRSTLPNQFYPIWVDDETHVIEEIGDPVGADFKVGDMPMRLGKTAVFPIRDDGTEMVWGCRPEELRIRYSGGYVRAASYNPKKPQPYSIQYLTSGTIATIESGDIKVTGRASDGSVIAEYCHTRAVLPKTQWDEPTHDARDYGNKILKNIVGIRFTFPKSLYAVHDAIRFFVANKPNALVLDFFAGSGTTMHAVNLLNAEDGGKRRCILVTNNEVSEDEAKSFRKQGLKPGDTEWESKGIAQYVTWPRTVCSIKGVDVKGAPLKGEYLNSGCRGVTALPMADGFQSNAAFFKLGFLDKTAVSLGKSFRDLLPLLWMKAGAVGACPAVSKSEEKSLREKGCLILPENHIAVLLNDEEFPLFAKEVKQHPEITHLFFVAEDEEDYRDMANRFRNRVSTRLYGNYLEYFTVAAKRSVK